MCCRRNGHLTNKNALSFKEWTETLTLSAAIERCGMQPSRCVLAGKLDDRA
jgi:hypothetical protein